MRIAILSFGSLVKNSKGLSIGKWVHNGPLLPVEFSRISRNKRLTLVINERQGVLNKAWYSISKLDNLDNVIAEVQKREKIEDGYLKTIGFIDIQNKNINWHSLEHRTETCKAILAWAEKNKFDAVVWVDLNVRFKDAIGVPYTPYNALNYIKTLTGNDRKRAIYYINSIPPQIKTNFRTLYNEYLKS